MNVVCKLLRLGQDSGKFSKKLIAAVERTNALVDDQYVKDFNRNWENSGRLYEIDKDATEKRNQAIKPKSPGRPKKL